MGGPVEKRFLKCDCFAVNNLILSRGRIGSDSTLD